MAETPHMQELRKHPLWPKIDSAIEELEENQDIEITTKRDLVIAFLVDRLR